ncbi:MAG: hypothetical protein RLZZ447_868 [Verrucomicrobiota bacterium]|jgi:hypothetical protein
MINLYLLLELLGFGVAFALGSIGLAWVGRRCMARIAGQAPGAVQDQRVAEVMKDAKSGVATVVGFVLALALSAARDQYSLASDIAVREAFEVLRLQRRTHGVRPFHVPFRTAAPPPDGAQAEGVV